MDWHLTWQDPVALALVVVCLAVTWVLRRRFGQTGCEGCASHGPAQPKAAERTGVPPNVIPLESLRLGKRS